jgi:hypothetical protein
LTLIHSRQDKLISEFESFKIKTDKQINYTYNDLIAVFRKFKTALLTKEKKDIVHLEKIFKQFTGAYDDFKKQTTNYELKTEHRIIAIKKNVEKELNENFIGFKEQMLGAVKKLQEVENRDNRLLTVQMHDLKLDVEATLEKFQKETENYLFNIDHEVEGYAAKLRKEMKNVDLHSAKQVTVMEKRFMEIKNHLQANIKAQQKQINDINDLLVAEKSLFSKDMNVFKEEFKQEFDHLSANLSNLNDVQIKLSKDDVMHHIDSVSDKFHDAAETNYKKLQQDLFHSEAENDKLKSLLKKQDAKMKAIEIRLMKKILAIEAKNKKKK